MRSNGHNSKRRARYSNGCNASAETIDGGHGGLRTGGDGNGREETTETKSWFEPVKNEEDIAVSDCPGGVCPVPWATDKERPVLTDNVNHPSHYTDGGIECIEAIEAQLTPEEYRGYLKGNVAKYVWREKHKGGIESLQKAEWYLKQLINQSL